jgi:hypothetical protein
VAHSQLDNDTVRARHLDLLPAGIVLKLNLGTTRTSTRGRNGQVDSVRVGPVLEFHVRRSVPSYLMLRLTGSGRAHILMRTVPLPTLDVSIERGDDVSWPRPSRRLDCYAAVYIDET